MLLSWFGHHSSKMNTQHAGERLNLKHNYKRLRVSFQNLYKGREGEKKIMPNYNCHQTRCPVRGEANGHKCGPFSFPKEKADSKVCSLEQKETLLIFFDILFSFVLYLHKSVWYLTCAYEVTVNLVVNFLLQI